MPLATPIAFFVFNRPDLTEASFARIRDQRPERLLVVGDGPRQKARGDRTRVAAVRQIIDRVDWECDVETLYASENLGLRRRMETGLDWVFAQVDRAIILEDDCVADGSFFEFCEALLSYYENNENVGSITGNNFQDGRWRGSGTYYFSKYSHCWGWATWARSWTSHDPSMPFWPAFSSTDRWKSLLPDPQERKYWERVFHKAKNPLFQSWAYPWTATCFFNGWVTAAPNENLVANIGFGRNATHTKSRKSLAPVARSIPGIEHPDAVRADVEADWFDFENAFGGRSLRDRRTPKGFAQWMIGGLRRRLLNQ